MSGVYYILFTANEIFEQGAANIFLQDLCMVDIENNTYEDFCHIIFEFLILNMESENVW